MANIYIQLTDELRAAIDAARGTTPLGPWLESQLRKLPAIKRAVDELEIELPERPSDGRGRPKNSE